MKEYTIKSQTDETKYSVQLYFDESGKIKEKSNCDCLHGSFFRYSKKNIASGNWKCYHIKEAIKKYKNKEPDNIEIEKMRMEVNNEKRKSIHPIF